MNRYPVLMLFLLFGLWGSPAFAQSGLAAAAAAQSKAAAAPSNSAHPDPADVKELVQTLNDPVQRAKLIAQLQLLTEQQAKAAPPENEALGTKLLTFLSAQVHDAGEEFGALGRSFAGLPAAERWFARQIADPAARGHWIDLMETLAIVLLSGAATIWVALLITRAPRKAISLHRESSLSGRLVFGAMRFLLALVPIGLFVVVCYALMSMMNPPALVQVAAITIVNATILVMAVIALSQFLLAPYNENLRLVPLSDGPSRFLHRWLCWIGAILAFGWFGITAARVLGLPRVAAEAAFKIVGIVLAVILIGLIFKIRREVARWIRGEAAELRGKKKSVAHKTAFWSMRQRLAEIWHILAAAYLVVIFFIWALNLKGGFDFVLRGTLISVAVIAITRGVVLLVDRAALRGIALSQSAQGRFPHIQERVDRYIPILRIVIVAIVWLAGLLGIIEVWGGGSYDWFQTPEGHVTLAKIFSIAVVIVSAVVAWELVSAIIERYLVGAVLDGSPVERSQRVRTLLPLLRNAFLIFLIVVVVLIVLSEIGLNIAPLLAGAGVVGLAIGFGAQTLVKDVITGVFILFENTIAVGDVIDLGGGHSGLVEAFSIRTVKLRDSSGGVHTVPFSNVSSVVNLTKDFAYYLFNIKVDYAQDTDNIVEILKALGAELQADPAYADLILAPIEIIGVDSFGSDAAILQARFKTKPIKQWSVGREFNRRLKKKFDALGIPQSFSQNMVLTGNGLSVQVRSDKAEAATKPD